MFSDMFEANGLSINTNADRCSGKFADFPGRPLPTAYPRKVEDFSDKDMRKTHRPKKLQDFLDQPMRKNVGC
jgi:hypothetical protein